jgi:glyoxylase-like metal-dependent hydrolase (beta-lactamase superfamily II)
MRGIQFFQKIEHTTDIALFFEIISGEDDQVGLEFGHLSDNIDKILVEGAQVKVADLDQADCAARLRSRNNVVFNLYGLRFVPGRVGKKCTSNACHTERQKPASADAFLASEGKAHKNLPKACLSQLRENPDCIIFKGCNMLSLYKDQYRKGKAIQIMEQSQQITDNISWVGVKHPELEIFDELFPTHNGTTYNSYVVRGQDKTALIDTVKAPFTDEFLDKIEDAVGLDNIDLVVISHTEPDHSGALGRLLEKRPDLQVYCSRPSQNFLGQLLNHPFNANVVSDGDEVDLGGLTLRFILAPYLHWPDTIFTYLVEEEVLFPCDAFGAHYCPGKLFDDQIPDFSKDFYFYFDCIMRPFKDKVRDAVGKVENLGLKLILS